MYNDFNAIKYNDPVHLKCDICNKPYTSKKSTEYTKLRNNRTLDICSKKCLNRHQQKSVDVACKQCNKKITKFSSSIKHSKYAFCTQSCSATYNNAHRAHVVDNRTKSIECNKCCKQIIVNIRAGTKTCCTDCRKENCRTATKKCIASRAKIRDKHAIQTNIQANCSSCNEIFFKTVKNGYYSVICSDECRQNVRSKNSLGVKSVYNGIKLDSNWELKVAKQLDLMCIKWVRPKAIKYIDLLLKQRNYFADFYLCDFDLYLDPKSDYVIKQQQLKLDIVSKQVKLIYGNIDMILAYIKTL